MPRLWPRDLVRVGGFAERCRGCAQRRRFGWDRAKIVAAIRRWTRRYGEPPAANDWSAAMVRGRPEKVARLREGDWPSVPTVQHYFGSWSAAIEAAGLTPRPWRPRKPGGATMRSGGVRSTQARVGIDPSAA